MPRGRKKGRKIPDSRVCSDDDADTADNRSVVSGLSDDIGSVTEDGVESEVDETASQETIEDKLIECFDLSSIKSAKGRQECLQEIHKILCKKYLFEFLESRVETATSAFLFCLKKGNGDEISLATRCTSLLCLQMGSVAGHAFSQLRSIMLIIMNDNSYDIKCRGQCALSLALCSLVATNEIEQITSLMDSLEAIFRTSYKKGDGVMPKHTPEVSEFHAKALSAWALLLSVTPAYITDKVVRRCLPKVPQLLNSSSVDLRINAGDTIALMYELARERDEDFEQKDSDLLNLLKVLATDCTKYRAKKDRRQQRSSFRDILRYIQLRELTEASVKFGREQLTIDSWVNRCQYNSLAAALGTGMNRHLQDNVVIRDFFGLGSPIPAAKLTNCKSTKLERALHNAAMFKARTKTRNKQRDKRSVNGY